MKYSVMVARHHDGFALWDSPSAYLGFTSMRTMRIPVNSSSESIPCRPLWGKAKLVESL